MISDKSFPNNDSKLLQCVDRVNQGVNRFTVDRVKDHFEEALGNKNGITLFHLFACQN